MPRLCDHDGCRAEDRCLVPGRCPERTGLDPLGPQEADNWREYERCNSRGTHNEKQGACRDCGFSRSDFAGDSMADEAKERKLIFGVDLNRPRQGDYIQLANGDFWLYNNGSWLRVGRGAPGLDTSRPLLPTDEAEQRKLIEQWDGAMARESGGPERVQVTRTPILDAAHPCRRAVRCAPGACLQPDVCYPADAPDVGVNINPMEDPAYGLADPVPRFTGGPARDPAGDPAGDRPADPSPSPARTHEATASTKHPHEPEIPPVLDGEGRCLVCKLMVELRDALQECDELERLREQDAKRHDTAWRTMKAERDEARQDRDLARNELGRLRRHYGALQESHGEVQNERDELERQLAAQRGLAQQTHDELRDEIDRYARVLAAQREETRRQRALRQSAERAVREFGVEIREADAALASHGIYLGDPLRPLKDRIQELASRGQ